MRGERNKSDLTLQLEAVIDTAIDAIITIDDKGIIEKANKATSALFGYSNEEMLGNNIKMLMPQPYRAEHDGYLDHYKTTRRPKIIGIGREVYGRKKDGEIFPLRLAVSEVILNDRVIFTGILHDLTDVATARAEIKELNRSLEQKIDKRTYDLESTVNKLIKANRELEIQIKERLIALQKLETSEKELKSSLEKEQELNALKSRFVSMASHEFRTPLTSIASSASLIARYPEGEQQPQREKHLGKIKKAVSILTGVLNDFLSLSKLEEGKHQLSLSSVDLAEVIDEVREGVKGILKPNQVITDAYLGSKQSLYTDQQILRNVLFNLVSNAIKYSDKNVLCQCTFTEDYLQVDVIDKGVGIPIEDQKHLFTRFFRASNVTNIQGTGLGLNIVRRYIDLLQGQISFVSSEQDGSTFTFTVPLNHSE
jgi:PAS domain S-box-containing protein